jgi:hypothetical protein
MQTFGPYLVVAGRVPVPVLIEFLAVCVRVCWSCHRFGGTNVTPSQMSCFLLKSISICLTLESDFSGDLGHSDSDAELVEVS